MTAQDPHETPNPFPPIPVQSSTPTYFQLDLPGVPWYIFNDHMNSYVPDRGQDTLKSCLVLDLSLATDKPMSIILGGVELPLGFENLGDAPKEGQWTKIVDENGRGPRGWHRSTQPVSSFLAYIGSGHAPSASYRTVLVGDAMYKVVVVVGAEGDDLDHQNRCEVIVKFVSVAGAGEIDFPFPDYTLSDDLQYRAERVFRITLETRGGQESTSGWTVVGAQGVEFQEDSVESESLRQGEVVEEVS